MLANQPVTAQQAISSAILQNKSAYHPTSTSPAVFAQNDAQASVMAQPTLVTTPSSTTATLDTTLFDTATLSGGDNETGSITFTLTAPGGAIVDTETVPVNGDGTYTTSAPLPASTWCKTVILRPAISAAGLQRPLPRAAVFLWELAQHRP